MSSSSSFLKGCDFTQFDFDRFARIAASVYREDNPYILPECLDVFRLYFQTYEKYMGRLHPPIRAEQVDNIMQVMPFLKQPDPETVKWMKETFGRNPGPDIYQGVYSRLIQLHFKTKYRHNDGNINFFFFGRIRELRLHEAEAGYE